MRCRLVGADFVDTKGLQIDHSEGQLMVRFAVQRLFVCPLFRKECIWITSKVFLTVGRFAVLKVLKLILGAEYHVRLTQLW